MKLNKTLSTLFLILFAASALVAQNNSTFKRADKLFGKMNYQTALDAYEKGLKKEDSSLAKERLADCYRLLGNYEMAEFWYGRATAGSNSTKESWFQYGKMLMANQKYDDAKAAFENFQKKGGSSSLASKNIGACEFSKKAIQSEPQYKITPLPLSTSANEFGAVPFGDGFLLTSARKRGAWTTVVNSRNNGRFYDIYFAAPSTGKSAYKAKPVRGKVNTRFHDGPAIYDAKTGTLYFTRSNFVSGKKGKSKEGYNKLKILSAQKSGKKWVNVKELSFNSNEYSCGHPTLSADGLTMVFSSDIPGGFGGADLYITRLEGDKWSTPENLGSDVNSEGDEFFPTLHENGMLFFSSNGHPGMGGLDIFSAELTGKKYGKVKNAGYPLNSSHDDFATTWIKNKAKGYFSSNRKGGQGGDDIYMFSRKISLKGTIVDSRTKAPMEGVSVSVMDVNNKKTDYITGKDGTFSHFVDFGNDYFLTMEMKDFFPKKARVSTQDGSPLEDKEVVIELEREVLFSAFGTVTDAGTGLPVSGATVRFAGLGTDFQVPTDANGKFFSQLAEDQEYELIVQKPGYQPGMVNVTTKGRTGPEDFQKDVALVEGPYLLVEGTVVDKTNQKPLDKSTIRAIAVQKQEEISTKTSRSDGKFWMTLDPRMDQYLLIGSRAYYFASRIDLPSPDSLPNESVEKVTIEMVRYRVGEVAKVIYYDYNKSDITTNASKKLYEMVYFLVDNPEAKVELGSHTDSRGGETYNQKLSQRRADAAVNFIVSKGIDKSRISSKGYGESKLTNKCNDKVECTDAEHGLNRRSELIITGIEEIPMGDGTGDSGNGGGKTTTKTNTPGSGNATIKSGGQDDDRPW
ncbi:MAG: carboxypeptidase regulatory-like domain-containing protein [Bacteroidia bacterium]|nr:carboxypeptidase regulatory-like domain-containing protein [Bacteroidia bacterium]